MMRAVFTIDILLAAALLAAASACSPADLQLLSAAGTPADGNMSRNSDSAISRGTPGEGPINANGSPSAVSALYPADGAALCPRPQVGVDLALSDATRKNGSFDASTVTLLLDGQDVTSSATVRETLSYPASRATLLYTPAADLQLGGHQAQFTYATATGPVTLTWNFTVAAIDCGQ